MEKLCKYCNSKFDTINIRRLFCSNACKGSFGKYNCTKENRLNIIKYCIDCNCVIESKTKRYCNNCLKIRYINQKKREYIKDRDKQLLKSKNKVLSKYKKRAEEITKLDFVQIKDFPDYYVNKEGKVYSVKSGYLKPVKNKDGYLLVHLRNFISKKDINRTIHRLVAEAFIPNLENKATINHINGIKTDNNIKNLEWNTFEENYQHYLKYLRSK